MKKTLTLLVCLFISGQLVQAENLTGKVNPFIGTTTLWSPADLGYTRTETKRAWGAESFPGSALPNAMVQLTPVTMYPSGSGYQYEDHQIYGFAHTCKGHWNLLHLPIMPATGRFYPDNFCSWFSHANESAHPGYYQVYLDRYHVNAELTSTLRCGFHRYTFRAGDEKRLIVDITRSNNRPRTWKIEKSGANTFQGFQDGEGRIYFYAVANHDVSEVSIQKDFRHQIAVVDFLNNKGSRALEQRQAEPRGRDARQEF